MIQNKAIVFVMPDDSNGFVLRWGRNVEAGAGERAVELAHRSRPSPGHPLWRHTVVDGEVGPIFALYSRNDVGKAAERWLISKFEVEERIAFAQGPYTLTQSAPAAVVPIGIADLRHDIETDDQRTRAWRVMFAASAPIRTPRLEPTVTLVARNALGENVQRRTLIVDSIRRQANTRHGTIFGAVTIQNLPAAAYDLAVEFTMPGLTAGEVFDVSSVTVEAGRRGAR